MSYYCILWHCEKLLEFVDKIVRVASDPVNLQLADIDVYQVVT